MPATAPTVTAFSWVLSLGTRMLASSLNLPEPLVYDTGVFVYARVQAAEHRAARTLCPRRLRRWLRSCFISPDHRRPPRLR